MRYRRMPIEVESPEELGYATIRYNLAESAVADVHFSDLRLSLENMVLGYGEHRGSLALRNAILQDEIGFSDSDVLVTTGAAMALFMVHTTLLNPQDHLVVIRPNYGTNLETPRAIGCQTSIIDLRFEEGFELDFSTLLKHLQPNTKLISLTHPHNPTGKTFSSVMLASLIEFAKNRGIYVLIDETYRALNFKSDLQPYWASMSDNVISVSSLSKAFGVPGIRMGWLLCKNKRLMTQFLAAKEQITLGNSVIDEEVAAHILRQKDKLLPQHHQHIRQNYNLLKKWMDKQEMLEWHPPNAGVVCFPRLKKEIGFDFELFKKRLYQDYQTLVGFGHWFEQPDKYFRIGFGYPSSLELMEGLSRFSKALEESVI